MDNRNSEGSNIYTDKNPEIRSRLAEDVAIHNMKFEVFDANDQENRNTGVTTNYNIKDETDNVIDKRDCSTVDKIAYDSVFKSTLPKVIPIHAIKVENDDIDQINSDVEDTIDYAVNRPLSKNIQIDIKVEAIDVSFERISEKEDINENMEDESILPKDHGIKVKNVDVINQGINTQDTVSYESTSADFVPVQSMEIEEGSVTQRIHNTRTNNKVVVSVLSNDNSNTDSNSSDEKDEDWSVDEYYSSNSSGRAARRKIPKSSVQTKSKTPKEKDPGGQLSCDSKVSCNLCPYQTNNVKHLSYHQKAHAATVSYRCDLCSYMTVNKYHLTFHYKVHSSEKSYSCNVCDKPFNSKGDLNRHFRTHSGEKPYACDICDRAFTDGTALRNHLRWHSGNKPYSCDICNKTFTQRGTLTSHWKTHSRKKPYSCKVCNKSYGYKISLTNHVRIHTGEVLHSCDICKKAFNSKGTLKTHFLLHTSKKTYSCDVCNKSFIMKSLLKKHLNKAHPDEKPYSSGVKSNVT